MTNKLPEGWENRGVTYCRRREGLSTLVVVRDAGGSFWALIDVLRGEKLPQPFKTPRAAMLALNEKYSLEVKKRGEG